MANKRIAGGKPNYPIPWIATYIITGIVLIAGSFIIVWYVNQLSSQYDYTDPDMRFLERIVISPNPRRGDFSALNEGGWQALCLVGWGGNLVKAMAEAKLPRASAEAFAEKYDALAGDSDRSAFVLLYSEKSGGVKALKHPHGFAFAPEGRAACTTKATPVFKIPVSE